jgi:hypothetical protein
MTPSSTSRRHDACRTRKGEELVSRAWPEKRRITDALAALAVLGVLAAHTAATALYLLPRNPIKASTAGVVNAYMDQFFQQDWHLFSPDPGRSSLNLWLACTAEDGSSTGWVDPAAPLLELHHRFRVGPWGKLMFSYGEIASSLIEATAHARAVCGAPGDDGAPLCAEAYAALARTGVYADARRFAIDKCREALGARRPLASVAMRIVELHPFPYSERGRIRLEPFARADKIDLLEIEVKQ